MLTSNLLLLLEQEFKIIKKFIELGSINFFNFIIFIVNNPKT